MLKQKGIYLWFVRVVKCSSVGAALPAATAEMLLRQTDARLCHRNSSCSAYGDCRNARMARLTEDFRGFDQNGKENRWNATLESRVHPT